MEHKAENYTISKSFEGAEYRAINIFLQHFSLGVFFFTVFFSCGVMILIITQKL